MKRVIFFIVISITVNSCFKEQIPGGLQLVDEANLKDTTYVITSIPAAQTKTILFEEATGVLCSNCPDGAALIKGFKSSYPNRILSVAIYSPFLNQFQPPAKYDFNSTDAFDVIKNLEGADVNKPSSAIDRVYTGDATRPYFFLKAAWAGQLPDMLSKTTPLNIDLSVTPTANDKEYVVKSKVTFTENTTQDLNITLYLLEDSVKDYQEFPGSFQTDYVHNHILRKVLTPLSGSTFLKEFATKEKGRVYEKFTTFKIPSTVIDSKQCHILCFVHKNGTNKEIIHSQEIHLK